MDPQQGSGAWVVPFLTIFGWFLIYYLNHRALKRAEISRQREGIQSLVQELIKWVYELQNNTSSFSDAEEIFSAKITQLELRFKTANIFMSKEVLLVSWLIKLELDIQGDTKTDDFNIRVKSVLRDCYELSDLIEESYHNHLQEADSTPTVLGLGFGTLLMSLYFNVICFFD